MAGRLPEEFGLSESLIEEVRARDERQAALFVRLLLWGTGVLWLTSTVLVFLHAGRAAKGVLVVAPLLGVLGAGIGSLPLAVLSGVVSWLVHPPHPKSRALARYEAATAGIRTCDVCRLARADETPKEGVSYCARCGAWICPDCRSRYDRRAIAALRQARADRNARRQGAAREST